MNYIIPIIPTDSAELAALDEGDFISVGNFLRDTDIKDGISLKLDQAILHSGETVIDYETMAVSRFWGEDGHLHLWLADGHVIDVTAMLEEIRHLYF